MTDYTLADLFATFMQNNQEYLFCKELQMFEILGNKFKHKNINYNVKVAYNLENHASKAKLFTLDIGYYNNCYFITIVSSSIEHIDDIDIQLHDANDLSRLLHRYDNYTDEDYNEFIGVIVIPASSRQLYEQVIKIDN